MDRDKLRQLLLDAGLDILKKDGLGTGAEGLTFKRVFDRVREDHGIHVTNASVIRRIWLNNDDYRSDVLALAVTDENQLELDAAVREGLDAVLQSDLSTLGGREEAVGELCRRAGGVYAYTLSRSRTWHLFVGIWGNVASRPKRRWNRRVTEAARLTYDNTTDRLEGVFAAFMDMLGLRLRTGMTARRCVLAVIALADGCAMRDRLDPNVTRRIVIARPGSEDAEWWLFAIGLEALVWHFFELDPDWVPAAS